MILIRTTRKPEALRLVSNRSGMVMHLDVEVRVMRFSTFGPDHHVQIAKPTTTTQRRALRRYGYQYRHDFKGWVK